MNYENNNCACGGALKGNKYTHSHEICMWERPEENNFWKYAVPTFMVLVIIGVVIELIRIFI